MDIRRILNDVADKFGDKPAVIFKGREISFKQLRDNTLRLASALKARGVNKSDKVAIYLPNCPEYIYSYLACFCLGAVGVPLDYMLKTDELISCISHSEARLLIARPKADVKFKDVSAAVDGLKYMVLVGGMADTGTALPLQYDSLMEEPFSGLEQIDISDSDPALIMYTSGTTGRPKGVLLNYRHLDGSPAAMEYFVDLSDRDVKLCAIPLSHIGGFIYIQNCIKFGITLVLMERFHPFDFLEKVQQYKVTCFHIVPPMYNAILTLKQIDRFDLASLRWVVVFGAPSSPAIMKRFHRYCPNARLLNGWGMTETCPPNTVTPLDSDNIASVGKPASHCQIKIVDDEDNELPAGKIGEVVIGGWVVMDGYYKDPEATATVLKDGWLYTGDLGRFDEEGFLYIVGRKKEMIKVAGQIVYAPEVEDALYKHEAVREVAVIGIHDKMKGEAVKAFVVLKDGAVLDADDLRYFARQHLANFKVPQSIEIVDMLPKNRTGKIDKAILKEREKTKGICVG